jgi:hypothetical protein
VIDELCLVPGIVGLLLGAVLTALIDVVGLVRARLAVSAPAAGSGRDDFHVLVPIYGSTRYLENVDYLAAYGARVVLCTTTNEAPAFYEELLRIARAHGFEIFYGECRDPRPVSGRRQTGGTTRDRLVRDALRTLTRPYVVCIDADTVTERPLGELVGALAARDLDLASVRLCPSNSQRWLGRLQAHEYRVAMALRRIMPWLVSGGCHVARTKVLADVMSRHSLFFQGNDVETGVLADLLGYRVGHIPFPVPTAVPTGLRTWFRQRFAWAGGEFRLFVVNWRLVRHHPAMWAYGLVVMFTALPLRWWSALSAPRALAVVLVIYLLLTALANWSHRDRWLLLMPFYAAFNSLIMLMLALPSYALMATRSRNAGVISRPRVRRSGIVERWPTVRCCSSAPGSCSPRCSAAHWGTTSSNGRGGGRTPTSAPSVISRQRRGRSKN